MTSRLPLPCPQPGAAGVIPGDLQPAALESAGTRPAVLLVDDDASVCSALRRQLHRDYDVTTCAGGAEAIERLQTTPFAVIVSDMRMPGVDGAEVLARARDLAPNTTRVLLTGYVGVDGTIAAINRGQIFRLLSKPCPTAEFQECVRGAVARHDELMRRDAQPVAVASDRHAPENPAKTGGLVAALRNGEFRLHYQPIVDLRTGNAVGVEALLRWDNPERGLLAPGKFIAQAEQLGLMDELGRWVLTAACEEVASWPVRNLKVSLNVSYIQLQQARYMADIERALSLSGLSPSRILLDVTEQTIHDCPEVLNRLHEIGVGLALDDARTPSELRTTHARVPFDVVKIDRELVWALPLNESSRGQAAVIVQFARDNGIEVGAEGVEQLAEHEICRDLGCSTAQGYLYAEPLAAAAALAALANDTFLPTPTAIAGTR
jgi:EAL domain-containing protein (putative c-di-GMP-specific phosphodiesterase class I)/ActR/RegA family two-component response regulator